MSRYWTADDGDSPLWGVFDDRGTAIAYMARREEVFAKVAGATEATLAAAFAEDAANAEYIVRAVNSHSDLSVVARAAFRLLTPGQCASLNPEEEAAFGRVEVALAEGSRP